MSPANSAVITFRIPEREAQWIDHFARKAGKKRSGWVRQLVHDAIIEMSLADQAREARAK